MLVCVCVWGCGLCVLAPKWYLRSGPQVVSPAYGGLEPSARAEGRATKLRSSRPSKLHRGEGGRGDYQTQPLIKEYTLNYQGFIL